MGVPENLHALDFDLAAAPGTVSVWCGPAGGPAAYARDADATHYAASTMKVALLVAAYRCAEAGLVDLDRPVPVRAEHPSAAPGGVYSCRREYDNDAQVWARVGGTATLRWLLRRMTVRSSNLAANLVLDQVGLAAADQVWRLVDAQHSVLGRGIEDAAAAAAGITNLVTAADLAGLLGALAKGADGGSPVASTASCQAILETLLAQECGPELAAGLPPGTRVAHKNGWIMGVRHAAGAVFPDDAAPFVVAVCATTPLAVNSGDDDACRLVTRICAAAWADRRDLAPG